MNFKKMFLSLFFVMAALCTCVYAKTVELNIGSTAAVVLDDDGNLNDRSLTVAPYAKDGTTLVPLRFISEFLGADVEWNPLDKSKVTIKTEEDEITITLGSVNAVVNGEEMRMNVAPVVLKDTTMVPVRFVSEVLSYYVDYIGVTNQITVSNIAPALTVAGKNVPFDIYKMYLSHYMNVNGPDADVETEIDNAVRELVLIYGSYAIVETLDDTSLFDSLPDAEFINENHDNALLKSEYAECVRAICAYNSLQNELHDSFYSEYDDELDEYYKDNFVYTQHILVIGDDASDTARNIKKRAKKGADFTELAIEYSADGAEPFLAKKGELVGKYEDAVFALKTNELSDAVETPYGYHIIKRLQLPNINEYREYVAECRANDYIRSYIEDYLINYCEIVSDYAD